MNNLAYGEFCFSSVSETLESSDSWKKAAGCSYTLIDIRSPQILGVKQLPFRMEVKNVSLGSDRWKLLLFSFDLLCMTSLLALPGRFL